MNQIDVRFRRPEHHETLLTKLTTEGPFATNYDALLFAAALGKQQERRTRFEKTGEKIRYALLANKIFGDTFVDMLSVTEQPDDAEILRDDRLDERILIFEEYANGGLDYLQGELNRRAVTVTDVIAALVTDALSTSSDDVEDAVRDIADQLDW